MEDSKKDKTVSRKSATEWRMEEGKIDSRYSIRGIMKVLLNVYQNLTTVSESIC